MRQGSNGSSGQKLNHHHIGKPIPIKSFGIKKNPLLGDLMAVSNSQAGKFNC